MSGMRVTLCLLTWNEINGVRHDLPRLPLAEFDEVFAVDGNSQDGTIEFLEGQGIKVLRQPRKSLNAAYQHAFRNFTTDAIVFFHPKGTIDPTDVRKFRRLFEDGHDLVIASRMLPESRNEEDAHVLRPRKWFVQALSLLAMLRWRREGNKVTDVLHGFRGISREALMTMRLTEVGTTMDLELVIQSYVHRLRRAEFPVTETSRQSGVTHFRAWPTGKELLKFFLAECFGRGATDVKLRVRLPDKT